MSELISFAKRFSMARKLVCLTKEELSEASGIDQTVITQMESGAVESPSTDLIFPLADALGVNARWLLTGQGAFHPPSG